MTYSKNLLSPDDAPSPPPSKTLAYGGVLVRDGQVLLRRPANDYDHYVWTYAKGKRDPGESPMETAAREVLEEMGYRTEIVGVLPAWFASASSATLFYLMRPVGEQGECCWETQTTAWVPLEDAHTWIAKTTNPKGRARDLAVLEMVRAVVSAS